MTRVSQDIREHLIFLDFPVPIFLNQFPTSKNAPDNVVMVKDAGGPEPNPKLALDLNVFDVRSRATNQTDAYNSIDEIRNILLGTPQFAAGTNFYTGIWDQVDITFLDRDEDNRFVYLITFRVSKQPDNTGYRQVSYSVTPDIQLLFDAFGGPAQYQVYINNLAKLLNIQYEGSVLST